MLRVQAPPLETNTQRVNFNTPPNTENRKFHPVEIGTKIKSNDQAFVQKNVRTRVIYYCPPSELDPKDNNNFSTQWNQEEVVASLTTSWRKALLAPETKVLEIDEESGKEHIVKVGESTYFREQLASCRMESGAQNLKKPAHKSDGNSSMAEARSLNKQAKYSPAYSKEIEVQRAQSQSHSLKKSQTKEQLSPKRNDLPTLPQQVKAMPPPASPLTKVAIVTPTQQEFLPEHSEAIQELQPQVEASKRNETTFPKGAFHCTNEDNKKSIEKPEEAALLEITFESVTPQPRKTKPGLEPQMELLHCYGMRLPNYREQGIVASLKLIAELENPETTFIKRDIKKIKEREKAIKSLAEHIPEHPDYEKIVVDLKKCFQSMGQSGLTFQAFGLTPSAENLINQTLAFQFPYTNSRCLTASLGPFLPPIYYLSCETEVILTHLKQARKSSASIKLSNEVVIMHLANMIKLLKLPLHKKIQQSTETLRADEDRERLQNNLFLHVKLITQLLLAGSQCYGADSSEKETRAVVELLDSFFSHIKPVESRKEQFSDLFLKFIEPLLALVREQKTTDILAAVATISEEEARRKHKVFLKPWHERHLRTQSLLLSALKLTLLLPSKHKYIPSIILVCSTSNLFSTRNAINLEQPFINEYTHFLLLFTTRLTHLLQEGPLLSLTAHRALAKAVKDMWLPNLSRNIPKLMGRQVSAPHTVQKTLDNLTENWSSTIRLPDEQDIELLKSFKSGLEELVEASEKANTALANEKKNHERIKKEVDERLQEWQEDPTITATPLDNARSASTKIDEHTEDSSKKLQSIESQKTKPTLPAAYENTQKGTSALSNPPANVKTSHRSTLAFSEQERGTPEYQSDITYTTSKDSEMGSQAETHQVEQPLLSAVTESKNTDKQAIENLSSEPQSSESSHQLTAENHNEKQTPVEAAINLPFHEMVKRLDQIEPLAVRHRIVRFWQHAHIAMHLLATNKQNLAQLHVKVCTINSLYNYTHEKEQLKPKTPPNRNDALQWLNANFPNQELSESQLLLLIWNVDDSTLKKCKTCVSNILQLLQQVLQSGQYLLSEAQGLGYNQAQLAAHFCVHSIEELRMTFAHIISGIEMLKTFEATLTQPIYLYELFTSRERILDSLGLGPEDHRNILSKKPSQVKIDFRNALAKVKEERQLFTNNNINHDWILAFDSQQLISQLTCFCKQFSANAVYRSAS